MTTFRSRCRAFTLGEVIVVLVVSSIVLVALLGGLIALLRSLQPQQVRVAGEVLPIAPTFGAFPGAVRLHTTFAEHVARARAVYVLGGEHPSLPSGSPPALVGPVRTTALPDLGEFAAGLPLDAHAFREAYSAALGEPESNSHVDDFTVVVVGLADERLAVTCLVQVRRREAVVEDGDQRTVYVVRDVRLRDSAGASCRYAFLEPQATASAVVVRAVHTWLRYSPAAGIAEEGPACVSFPDPWVHAGSRGRPDDLPPFSRFRYFLAVSR